MASTAKLRIIGLLLVVALFVVGLAVIMQTTKPRKASIGASETTAQTGHQLKVPIEIDTGGLTINAAEVNLRFDNALVEVVRVSKEQSFFTLWIDDQPQFSNEAGTISFAGGVFSPGFKGKAQVGAVILRSKRPLTTTLAFASGTQVLLNDGKGTAVPLELSPITVEMP